MRDLLTVVAWMSAVVYGGGIAAWIGWAWSDRVRYAREDAELIARWNQRGAR